MIVQVPESLADDGQIDVQVTAAELIRAWKPAHGHPSLRLASFLATHLASTAPDEQGAYVWPGPNGGGQWYTFTPLRSGETPSRYLLRQANRLLREARAHGWLTLTANGRTFDLSRLQPPLLEITVPISQAQYLYLCRAYGNGVMHHPGELTQFINTLLGQTLTHLMPDGQQGHWSELTDALDERSPRARAGERAV